MAFLNINIIILYPNPHLCVNYTLNAMPPQSQLCISFSFIDNLNPLMRLLIGVKIFHLYACLHGKPKKKIQNTDDVS